jgi:hypothetical protein
MNKSDFFFVCITTMEAIQWQLIARYLRLREIIALIKTCRCMISFMNSQIIWQNIHLEDLIKISKRATKYDEFVMNYTKRIYAEKYIFSGDDFYRLYECGSGKGWIYDIDCIIIRYNEVKSDLYPTIYDSIFGMNNVNVQKVIIEDKYWSVYNMDIITKLSCSKWDIKKIELHSHKNSDNATVKILKTISTKAKISFITKYGYTPPKFILVNLCSKEYINKLVYPDTISISIIIMLEKVYVKGLDIDGPISQIVKKIGVLRDIEESQREILKSNGFVQLQEKKGDYFIYKRQ